MVLAGEKSRAVGVLLVNIGSKLRAFGVGLDAAGICNTCGFGFDYILNTDFTWVSVGVPSHSSDFCDSLDETVYTVSELCVHPLPSTGFGLINTVPEKRYTWKMGK